MTNVAVTDLVIQLKSGIRKKQFEMQISKICQ